MTDEESKALDCCIANNNIGGIVECITQVNMRVTGDDYGTAKQKVLRNLLVVRMMGTIENKAEKGGIPSITS